jgi:hypothetical protein
VILASLAGLIATSLPLETEPRPALEAPLTPFGGSPGPPGDRLARARAM